MSSLATKTRVGEFSAAVRNAPVSISVTAVGLDGYEIDGVTPELMVEPADVVGLQTILAEASGVGVSAIPLGAGTQIHVGNTPASYDVAISLRSLDRIIEYEPADLVVTVEAGLPLADLQALLATQRQFLPLDPPCDPRATIGGVIATNAYGPLRHAFGTARDWLIGIRVVHADGSLSKSGGRVVKNVTGYDMHKLYVGSLGSLGVIADVTLKVSPRPQVDSTVALGCRSAAHGSDMLFAARDAGLAINAAELLSPPAAHTVLGHSTWSLLLRVAGGSGAVTRSLSEVAVASNATGATVDVIDTAAAWQAWSLGFRAGDLALRVSVAPARVAEAMEVIDRHLTGTGALVSATVAAGLIRVNLRLLQGVRPAALAQVVQEVASRYDGSAVIEAAPPSLKRDVDVFGPLRSDFPIMKRLKDEFDPKRTLAPGRFVGRL